MLATTHQAARRRSTRPGPGNRRLVLMQHDRTALHAKAWAGVADAALYVLLDGDSDLSDASTEALQLLARDAKRVAALASPPSAIALLPAPPLNPVPCAGPRTHD